MNIKALRYSLIEGTEGYKHESTMGPIKEIKLDGAIMKHHNGTFTASFHYLSDKQYQDDFKQWRIIEQLEKPDVIHKNYREVQVHPRKNVSPSSKR